MLLITDVLKEEHSFRHGCEGLLELHFFEFLAGRVAHGGSEELNGELLDREVLERSWLFFHVLDGNALLPGILSRGLGGTGQFA